MKFREKTKKELLRKSMTRKRLTVVSILTVLSCLYLGGVLVNSSSLRESTIKLTPENLATAFTLGESSVGVESGDVLNWTITQSELLPEKIGDKLGMVITETGQKIIDGKIFLEVNKSVSDYNHTSGLWTAPSKSILCLRYNATLHNLTIPIFQPYVIPIPLNLTMLSAIFNRSSWMSITFDAIAIGNTLNITEYSSGNPYEYIALTYNSAGIATTVEYLWANGSLLYTYTLESASNGGSQDGNWWNAIPFGDGYLIFTCISVAAITIIVKKHYLKT